MESATGSISFRKDNALPSSGIIMEELSGFQEAKEFVPSEKCETKYEIGESDMHMEKVRSWLKDMESMEISEIHSDGESTIERPFLSSEDEREVKEDIKWLSYPSWDIELLISQNGELYEAIQNPLWEEQPMGGESGDLEMALLGDENSLSFESVESAKGESLDSEKSDSERNWWNSVVTIIDGHKIYEVIRNPLWENRHTFNWKEGINSEEELIPVDSVEGDFCQYLGNGEFYLSIDCWNSIINDMTNQGAQEIDYVLDWEDNKYSNLFDEGDNVLDYGDFNLEDDYYDDNFRKEFSPEMFDPGLKGMMLYMYKGYTGCLQSAVQSAVGFILPKNRHMANTKN